jgi:hypothetical protein
MKKEITGWTTIKSHCQDCDKELSEEKGEYAHGCLDCHGTVPSDKLFWLRKKLAETQKRLDEAEDSDCVLC